MEPLFTEEQLNRMSREDLCSLFKIMQQHQQKQETTIRLLEEQKKELEFLNAMLSDRLTLAQKKRFGASSEKYAEGYTQLSLFMLTLQKSYTKGLLTLLTHRETSEAPAYFYRSCGRHP